MQTPNLSSTVRAWMKDPQDFARRMKRRAEELWLDGYSVEPASSGEVGVFVVNTPKEERHLVNLLTGECTCTYAVKNEIPQVKCKHLQGIGNPDSGLIHEQICYYQVHADQAKLRGNRKAANEWWGLFHGLVTAFNAAHDEARARQAEEEEDARALMEASAIDEELRHTTGQAY